MSIFLIASVIVIIALTTSLIYWVKIRQHTSGTAHTAARLFMVCFSLYIVGQSLVVLQSIKLVRGYWDVPSYLYGLAAILFAIGSYYQYKSHHK